MADPIVRTIELSKTFEVGGQKVKALRRANLEVMPGEFIAIMGPSGSGKTTLIELLLAGPLGKQRIAVIEGDYHQALWEFNPIPQYPSQVA